MDDEQFQHSLKQFLSNGVNRSISAAAAACLTNYVLIPRVLYFVACYSLMVDAAIPRTPKAPPRCAFVVKSVILEAH